MINTISIHNGFVDLKKLGLYPKVQSKATQKGLGIHNLAHDLRHMKINGAVLKPSTQNNFLVGSGLQSQRHHKVMSIEDLKKRPISKIF